MALNVFIGQDSPRPYGKQQGDEAKMGFRRKKKLSQIQTQVGAISAKA